MYKARVRYDASCPKHPRFNPQHGESAVKGGCVFCLWLLDLQAAERVFRKTLAQYQEGKAKHLQREAGL